jgi:hypothetical protein
MGMGLIRIASQQSILLPMKNTAAPVAVTMAWLLAGVVQAAELIHSSATIRRPTLAQISQCMKKRMSGDRLITYNDALKACAASIVARAPVAPRSLLVTAAIRPTGDPSAVTESKQGRTLR